MSRIVTVTFSPCIDKSTSVPVLLPEKKLKCSAPKLEPGGGGINISRAIKKLGGGAITIFPSGGYTGKYFNYLLQQEDIETVIIETSNETRENIIVVDEATNKQYRFGMPGTPLQEREWQQCLQAVAEAENAGFVVASGSLPPGVPMDIYARLAKLCRKINAKFIVDTSGEALVNAADEGVYLLKPNLGELAALAGRQDEKLSNEDVKNLSREIISKGKCEVFVVSMGAAGAMLITATASWQFTPPKVTPKSTVGAGDSMVAGIIHALQQGKSIEDAVKLGVACGTAATMNAGTELFKPEDLTSLLPLVQLSAT